jgi:hypothetical protein
MEKIEHWARKQARKFIVFRDLSHLSPLKRILTAASHRSTNFTFLVIRKHSCLVTDQQRTDLGRQAGEKTLLKTEEKKLHRSKVSNPGLLSLT